MRKSKFKLLVVTVFVLLMTACMSTGDAPPETREVIETEKQAVLTWHEEWAMRGLPRESLIQFIRRVICTEPYDPKQGTFSEYVSSYNYYKCDEYTLNKA